MKPTLRPPGTERLKLEYDGSLSNFAFYFNLRRYNSVMESLASRRASIAAAAMRSLQSGVGAGAGGGVLGLDEESGSLAGAYTRPLLNST
jgi:hypothetical protein